MKQVFSLLVINLLIELAESQQPVLFPLFFERPQTAALPPKVPKGRPAIEKMKSCCTSLKDADADCKARFCDFNSIGTNNVSF